MDRRIRELFLKALASPERPRNPQRVAAVAPRLPSAHKALFQGFRPPYQYNNGISQAYFVKMVFWTDAGKWCGQWVGQYQTDMVGGGEYWTERYFWGFRNGSFQEIKQHGVRGPRKRLLRG